MSSKVLKIKSQDKIRGTNSNFSVKFNNYLDLHNVAAVSIKSVTFPNVFYNIPSSFNLSLTDSTAGNFSIAIAAGNYTIDTLAAWIKQGIEAVITPRTFTMQLNAEVPTQTQKIAFTVSSGTLTINASNAETAKYLGITSNIACTTKTYAQEIPNLMGETMAYIYSKELSQQKYIDESGHQSIIAECPINVGFGYLNIYESNSSDLIDTVEYTNPINLNEIDISIRNSDGELLDLGENHHVTISLKIFY